MNPNFLTALGAVTPVDVVAKLLYENMLADPATNRIGSLAHSVPESVTVQSGLPDDLLPQPFGTLGIYHRPSRRIGVAQGLAVEEEFSRYDSHGSHYASPALKKRLGVGDADPRRRGHWRARPEITLGHELGHFLRDVTYDAPSAWRARAPVVRNIYGDMLDHERVVSLMAINPTDKELLDMHVNPKSFRAYMDFIEENVNKERMTPSRRDEQLMTPVPRPEFSWDRPLQLPD